MTNEEKKKNERIILNKFLQAYKEQIDQNSSFVVLDNETIQKTHSDYNGENPDFGIRFNGKLIGIELTQLSTDKLEPSQMKNISEEKATNVGHLHSMQKNNPNRPPYLYSMEDLAKAAADRINEKIKKKYISCPVWLVCYAVEPYNQFILSPHIEDGDESKIASEISEAIIPPSRIDPKKGIVSIWLAEFSGKDCLLKILIQTLPSFQ